MKRMLPLCLFAAGLAWAVDVQPVLVHAGNLADALQHVGAPLDADRRSALDAARKESDDAKALAQVEEIFDPLSLVVVTINPESRVSVAAGQVAPKLVEQGWAQVLVKVVNQAGVTAPLQVRSPQARSLFNAPADQVRDRWLELKWHEGKPLLPKLSGIPVEYRILQLYSRDAGKRAAVLRFDVGQGTQDLGFRSNVTVNFDCAPSVPVTLSLKDEDGKPAVAAFVIRDRQGRVYPSQAKRLAPDFAFHPQVYREDGESIRLPAGTYAVHVRRGPETLEQHHTLEVGDAPLTLSTTLKRWIDPAARGWWSGDHHIHAAGCKHYTNPSEGVHAPDMLRHCRGEDLKVGANLTWGPCFDYQKQFFTGKDDKASKYPFLLRYDVEVSGFGSHRSGHLCLLRLKNQIYPGGDSKDHWPTLCLNTLKWAQKQGAVCGPAHSGWGLKIPGLELPNYTDIPPFDGIGACEYIVDVTHEVEGPRGEPVPAVDFMSLVDTPYTWELNMWYHALNCGFRTRVSGETDFPCIYGERVGLGRSYVKLPGKLNYDDWCAGIEAGRAYVSDGSSHLLDFAVNGVPLGGRDVEANAGDTLAVTVSAACRLGEEPRDWLRRLPVSQKPFWHAERARIRGTRKVPVEVLVNGEAVARREIVADGTMRDLAFEVPVDHSAWLAVRILPSAHTNPVWVKVGDRPVRHARSLEWAIKAVDQCWREKKSLIAKAEMQDAVAAYDHARAVYRKRLAEARR